MPGDSVPGRGEPKPLALTPDQAGLKSGALAQLVRLASSRKEGWADEIKFSGLVHCTYSGLGSFGCAHVLSRSDAPSMGGGPVRSMGGGPRRMCGGIYADACAESFKLRPFIFS